MREGIIRAIITRMLTDGEFKRTMHQAPLRALRMCGLAGDETDATGPRALSASLCLDDDDCEPAAEARAVEDDRQLAAATCAIVAGVADAVTFLRRGTALQRRGDHAGAMRDFSRAIDCGAELAAEDLAAAYDGRGSCRRRRGNYAGAVADGERAVALAPQRARYHVNLGIVRLRTGDREGALSDLSCALALDPHDHRARAERGRCYQARGEHEHAIADFDQLLAIGRAPYRTLLARAYSQAALGNLGLALVDCEIAARQLGDYQVYKLRGYVLYRIGDLYGALEDLSHAIGLHAEQAVLYLWRGLVYYTLGDVKAACEDLVEFVLRQPDGVAIGLRELASAIDLALLTRSIREFPRRIPAAPACRQRRAGSATRDSAAPPVAEC